MKTKIRNIRNSVYKLVIDLPKTTVDEEPVLAVLTHFEGTGCWSIEDVRLGKHKSVGKYFGASGEDYWSSFDAKNSQEAGFVRSLLRDFKEAPSDIPNSVSPGSGVTHFDWCTFNALVPGLNSAELSGYPVNLSNGAPLFHSRKNALEHLKSIAEFWEAWPHSELDEDIVKKASAVKIDNPSRQLSETEMFFTVSRMVREAITRGPTIEALNATPSMGHVPSSASSVFSCVTDEHLNGFIPIARFGRLVTPSDYNTNLKLSHHADRKTAVKTFAEDWLLLEKNGNLFVDCLKGTVLGRGWGVNPDSPRLVDISLPSAVYDFFKVHAGKLWPEPVLALSPAEVSEMTVEATKEVAVRRRRP